METKCIFFKPTKGFMATTPLAGKLLCTDSRDKKESCVYYAKKLGKLANYARVLLISISLNSFPPAVRNN